MLQRWKKVRVGTAAILRTTRVVTLRSAQLGLLVAALLGPLSGSGFAASSKLQKPSRVSFGKQVVNTTSPPKVVTIRNSGRVPITIQSVALTGSFIEASNCVGVLAPAGTCAISVAFRPTAGTKSKGNVLVTDDAKGSPQKIALSGIGKSSVAVTTQVASLPGSIATNLVAVSPLGEAHVGSDPSSATFQTSPTDGQVVGVIDTARGFGWTAVLPGWLQQPNPQVGPLSTAVFYVFMVPGIFTDNLSQQSATLSALANLADVQTFANALQSNASGGNPLLVPEVQTDYQQAVTAGLVAAGSLPPPAARKSELTLALAGSTKAPAVAVSEAAVSYNGPVALNETYAEFVVNSATSTAVTVNPQWLPASGTTSGIGQGLYWIAAVYGVDSADYYTSFANFAAQFASPNSAWNTDIHLNRQLLLGNLSPQTNLFSLLDIFTLADALFTRFTGSSSTEGSLLTLSPNQVYALHLYTCGFGLGTPANRSADTQLINQWDNPEALDIWMASCGVNLSLIAVDLIGMVSSIPDLLDNPSCKPQEDNAISHIAQTTLERLVPLLSIEPQPTESELATTVGEEAVSAVEDFIPVAACAVAYHGLEAILNNLNLALKILSVVSNAGNLVNTIGSSLEVEPWQGAYIEVGNPVWASPTATATPTVAGSWSGTLTQPNGGISTLWNEELNLLQDPTGAVSGTRFVAATDQPADNVKWSVSGQFSDGSLTLNDVAIVSTGNPSLNWCVDTTNLTLSTDGTTLSGTWASSTPDCGGGSVSLTSD